jgi:hypothetical protein
MSASVRAALYAKENIKEEKAHNTGNARRNGKSCIFGRKPMFSR